MSAKVYALEDREFVGNRCWVEIVMGAGKGHYLGEAEVEFVPLRKNPSFSIGFSGGGMLIPQEKYGECYVFWDGKPEEPYFKDGWPEWREITTARELTQG